VLLSLFTLIALVVFSAYELLGVIFKGPSQTAGDILTISLLESSAGKFVPYLYYSDAEVEEIQNRNRLIESEEQTDTSLIVIETPEPAQEGETATQEEDDITVEVVTGATYKGWMLIVKDPSRVRVGVSSENFSEGRGGMHIDEIAEKYDAVAAINGGAFVDSGGTGNGGMPSGLTVAGGEICNYSGGSEHTTVGFDNNNILVVGKFTKAQAKEMGLRDAVSFGPALVVNGEPSQFEGVSSGLNPRTAIGQRADGAVLMLVIDGRQVNSLGASMADLVDIMVRYGAVNACNLDGGSSSNMVYEGEILNDGVAVTGSRRIPTAFVVQ
jgi:exopolysaccharide biosynthesis protein